MHATLFRSLVVVAACLTSAGAVADGLIVIHRPPPGFLPPHSVPHPFAPLEVREHHVSVTIRDQLAVTEVDQTFFNPNGQRLEGDYLFPVPKGARIDAFAMDIDGRMTEAELLDADKARKIYADIVRRMKDPALLEYAGQDLFRVRIFPIEPNAPKRVKLKYSQLLRQDGGLVEYVYPLNTEKFSARPIRSVSIKVSLETKQPLKSIYSPSHALEIARDGDRRASVVFEARDTRPDTDFRLFHAVEPRDDLGLGMLLHRDGEEGTFALLAAPPTEAHGDAIAAKDVVFVIDTSGSMAEGDKLGQARKALEFCLRNLNPGDRFDLVRFATEAEPLFDGLIAIDDAARDKALGFVRGLKPIGGTAIEDALKRALKVAAAGDPARPCFVVFLTDGLPTVGTTDGKQLLEMTAKAVGDRTIRVFCLGVGTDVNTHLLDGIAERTRAASQYVLPGEDLEVKLSTFYAKIANPVLAALELAVDGPVRLLKVHPAPLPDLFKGEQLVVFGRFTGHGEATVTLSGTVNGARRSFSIKTSFPERALEQDFLPRLWAVRRVGFLLDQIRLHGESKELRDEAAALARAHGIVTPYTAWLILEDEGRRNVAVRDRTLREFAADARAADEAGRMFKAAREQSSGAGAVGSAQAYDALRRAENAAAPAAANVLAARGQAGGGAAEAAVERQQARSIRGRTFYLNGDRWTDALAQDRPAAARARVAFNSDDYFALLDRHPDAAAWLALGRNVDLLLGDTVYEIGE